MSPVAVARELGIDPRALRSWLRRNCPRSRDAHGTAWMLKTEEIEAARAHFGPRSHSSPVAAPGLTVAARSKQRTSRDGVAREGSDEAYVIDLCDGLLGERARRQHRFEWLEGDASASGARRALPVDAYYERQGLVVEYRERQHHESVPFFDRRQTVSGVGRGEQRRLYDRRREEEIPKHGLRLVAIRSDQLRVDRRGRLLRDERHDSGVLAALLKQTASHGQALPPSRRSPTCLAQHENAPAGTGVNSGPAGPKRRLPTTTPLTLSLNKQGSASVPT